MNRTMYRKGIATLELLIALVFLLCVSSAAIVLIFAGQSIAVDSQTNGEALALAQSNMETLRAVADRDMSSVVSSATTTDPTGFYSMQNQIVDYQCLKQITGNVSWAVSADRRQQVALTSFYANLPELQRLGFDCDPHPAMGAWQNLSLKSTLALTLAGQEITGIDALDKILFVSTQSANPSNPDLYIFDAGNPAQPQLKYSLDAGPGLNANDVILSADNNFYIYAAGTSTTAQLNVIKIVKDLSAPPQWVAAIGLPGIAGSYPQGKSIFYYDGKIYIATHRTAGRELQVYDVSANPASPVWKGSLEINHNINGIVVRQQLINGIEKTFVYMATSGNADDLITVDVTDPAHLAELPTACIDLPGNEDGKSLYISGNNLYLGRYKSTVPSDADFYILDISHPDLGVPILASKNLSAGDINSVRVSGDIAFLGTADASGLRIVNVANNSIIPMGAFNFSQKTSGLDLENNLLYMASPGDSSIKIIGPGP